jgi:hypothetical protein
VISLLATPDDVLAEPGAFERIVELGGDAPPYPLGGLSREELVEVAGGGRGPR